MINRLKRYNVSAQRELYERYAVQFKYMCLKYVNRSEDADDILQEGFMKIYKHIHQFKAEGSFEGWMKRIIINTAIQEYKKNKRQEQNVQFDEIHGSNLFEEETEVEEDMLESSEIDPQKIDYSLIEKADFSTTEMNEVINKLKPDFKIVFNLYFLENYKHAEIAKSLDIQEKTSRSRLLRARKYVQNELYKLSIEKLSKK